jgi:hypothetical protein
MLKAMYTITDPHNNAIPVTIQRDKRLKKSLRWSRQDDGGILVRVPQRYPRREYAGILRDLETQLAKTEGRNLRRAKGRTDADLQARAERINRDCFEGELAWAAIRWVGNMRTRLGSCTNGGTTDGHIRIADTIKTWPDWVIDYVIAHELAHRKHPDHGKAFWAYLRRGYPKTERARGFIKGVGFAQGQVFKLDDE